MLLRRVRHYFNMIEITLAIAIMGVGITSLMVLLPVGLRNSQESISNNYVPIIADYFYSLIRTDLMFSRTKKTIKLPGVDSEEEDGSGSSTEGVTYYEYESLTSSVIGDFEEKPDKGLIEDSDSDADTILSIDSDGKISGSNNWVWMRDSSNELEIDEISGENKVNDCTGQPVNIFYKNGDSSDYVVVFRSKSETGDGLTYDMVDFAAEVKLFKDDGLKINNDGSSFSSDDLMRVYMHISWPIELPLSKRQSRVYVWDVARGVFE